MRWDSTPSNDGGARDRFKAFLAITDRPGTPRVAPGIASALPGGMLYEHATPTAAGYRDVSPNALRDASGAVRVVDVREPHELRGELGHIRGADAVPLATLAARARAWRRDEEVVLVCRSGGRSSQAARILVTAGFQKVMNLAGGMLAYNAAGLPVARR